MEFLDTGDCQYIIIPSRSQLVVKILLNLKKSSDHSSELLFHQKYYLHKKISVFLFTLHGVWIWLPSGKNDWRFLMPRMGKLFSFYPDQHRIEAGCRRLKALLKYAS